MSHDRRPDSFHGDYPSSYQSDLEGQANELGNYGYNRDGKRGKQRIVMGLLVDGESEPLGVRVFERNMSDPTTVGEQIRVVKEESGVEKLVFVLRPGHGEGAEGAERAGPPVAAGCAADRYLESVAGISAWQDDVARRPGTAVPWQVLQAENRGSKSLLLQAREIRGGI